MWDTRALEIGNLAQADRSSASTESVSN
jgi:hypothetical protein